MLMGSFKVNCVFLLSLFFILILFLCRCVILSENVKLSLLFVIVCMWLLLLWKNFLKMFGNFDFLILIFVFLMVIWIWLFFLMICMSMLLFLGVYLMVLFNRLMIVVRIFFLLIRSLGSFFGVDIENWMFFCSICFLSLMWVFWKRDFKLDFLGFNVSELVCIFVMFSNLLIKWDSWIDLFRIVL